MTQRARQVSGIVLATTVVAGILSVLILAQIRSSAQGPARATVREIVLEARGTAFDGRNPVLDMKVGERVRLVVRNTDNGVVHSIAIPELGIERTDIRPGDEAVFEVTASEPGTHEYLCPQHLPLMKGKLVVHR